MSGWIKLHRELMEKAIWIASTPEQTRVMIALLLMANHDARSGYFKGAKILTGPGQMLTSLEQIAAKAGVSSQNARTALKKFEKLEFLTNESTKHGRLITITNWAIYQGEGDESNKQPNSQLTNDQQTANKQLTIDKNERIKEIKPPSEVINKRGTRLPLDWVPSTELVEWAKKKRPDLDILEVTDAFKDYWKGISGSKGVKDDWDATFRNWIRNTKPVTRPASAGSVPGNNITPHTQRQAGVIPI